MPACIAGVVVTLIGRVPAKNYVAEAKAAFEGGGKLIFVDDFTPKNAVDIGDGEFHFAHAAVLYCPQNVFTHSLLRGDLKQGSTLGNTQIV
ncbi:MAG: hypothetical protein AAF194_01350 [Pseudomonadota bacterium]